VSFCCISGEVIVLYTVHCFYRATRMHSVDYAVATCLFVRLSVCLSHADILSKHTYLYPYLYMSLKVFSLLGSPTILVFPHESGWQYSDKDPPPPNGGVEWQGDMKKVMIFGQYLVLSRNTCMTEP